MTTPRLPGIRALTVRPPWSPAIVDGHKPIENRSGGFTKNYQGLMLVHAGTSISTRGLKDKRILRAYPDLEIDPPRDHPLLRQSVILGWAELANSHRAEPGCCSSPWAEWSYVNARGETVDQITHLVLINPPQARDADPVAPRPPRPLEAASGAPRRAPGASRWMSA